MNMEIVFQHPEYLFLLPVVAVLALWAGKRRQHVTVASEEQMVPAGIISRSVVNIPLFCWFVLSGLLVTALANPQTSLQESYVSVDAKKAMLCVDASASMGEGKHGSAMDSIKVMLHDFVGKRLNKGDYLGVSAYSGQTNTSRGFGYARIIQYPTQDSEVANAAIKALRPSMFGNYSAVGDGIFVAIIALIENQVRQEFGGRFDRLLLEDNLWSLGSGKEDVAYAVEIAEKIGQQKGHYIVLFTDGKFNTGMNPASALWFAERLGLKVHFIAFSSSAATGLSREEQELRKAQTIAAVLRTGGTYKESNDVQGVAGLLEEIDRAEKVQISIEQEPTRKTYRNQLYILAVAVFGIWICFWMLWHDPL